MSNVFDEAPIFLHEINDELRFIESRELQEEAKVGKYIFDPYNGLEQCHFEELIVLAAERSQVLHQLCAKLWSLLSSYVKDKDWYYVLPDEALTDPLWVPVRRAASEILDDPTYAQILNSVPRPR